MANWYIDSTRIFVQEFKDSGNQIIARLNPLAGGTTLHTFGWDDRIVSIRAIVVGTVDIEAIFAMRTDGAQHTLYGAWLGSEGGAEGPGGLNFYVKNIDVKALNSICQTLRPDLDDDAYVFSVDIELYRDEEESSPPP